MSVTFPHGVNEHPEMHSNSSREGRHSSFLHTGLLIALLHLALLAAVLWRHTAPPPPPHEVALSTIEAQLISPDAAPVPAQVESRPQPVLKPAPKPAPKPNPKAVPTPKPVLPVQAAPAIQVPAAPPASTSPPEPAAAAPASVEAPPHPTLASTAPKNVEHLECAIARPDYPALSRRSDESGTAMVQIIVDTQGRIESATLRKSSNYARLDNAALQAAQDSHCRPYLENGTAIRSSAVVPFRFMLDN